MLTIRNAVAEDREVLRDFAEKFCAEHNRLFDATINVGFADSASGERHFQRCIEEDTTLALLAEDNGRAVGFLTGSVEPFGNFRTITTLAEVDMIWVSETHRSRGVGKDLLDAFDAWARERGAQRLRVSVSASNIRAIDFYMREDFAKYDVVLEKE